MAGSDGCYHIGRGWLNEGYIDSPIIYGYGFGGYRNDPPATIVKPNSGHLRVSVSPEKLTVDYIQAYLPGDGTNGHIEYIYSIAK